MSGNCQATLKFECDSKKLGYYQSELAFHFQRGSHTYVISRTVKAYVGEKDLFEQLMPKVPYKKKVHKPAIVSDDGDYIGAGKIPELNSDLSRYVRKLNFYDVPSKVRQVLFAPASTRELPVHQEFAMEFLPHDYAPLGSYSQHYSHLLWAEEAQLEVDIRQFSMFGVDVISQARGRSFVIKVPGLAEGRPSILIGDSILVKKSNDRNARAFEGRAVEMRLDEVVLKFNPKFNDRYINGEKYDVQFKYNRNPWRRMQLAIATSSEMLTGFDTLYRGKEAEKKSLVAEKELKMVDEYRWQPFNRMLFDNPEQRRAVSIIVNDSFHPFPFLIHGPPVLLIDIGNRQDCYHCRRNQANSPSQERLSNLGNCPK
jgi:helicase MOV-10